MKLSISTFSVPINNREVISSSEAEFNLNDVRPLNSRKSVATQQRYIKINVMLNAIYWVAQKKKATCRTIIKSYLKLLMILHFHDI